MKKHLTIDIGTLPEEGKTFSGELDPSIFSFLNDEIRALEPLFYELYIQRFESELLLRGTLSTVVELTCVRDLNKFSKTLEINDLCTSIEISSGQIDLTNTLREEIILLFPDYPHCDDADDPKECILDSRYLAVDKPTQDDVKTPPASEKPNPWAALDNLSEDDLEDDTSH